MFFALSAIVGSFVLQAQQSDDEKSTPIRKARAVTSSDESPTPKPKTSPHKKKKSPTPTTKKKKTEEAETSATPGETPEAATHPKPKKSSAKENSPTPKAKKKKTEEAETPSTPGETPEASTHPKPKKNAAKETSARPKKKKRSAAGKAQSGSDTPTPHKKKSAKPSETPPVKPSPAIERAIAVPGPSAQAPPPPRSTSSPSFNAPPQEPEQLTIEKYGYEKPRGFWARLFGGGGRSPSSGAGYRYLTASVKAQIDRAPVARGRWQYIVVHNSGTRQGNAAAFDYYHRHFKRMQNGLAYHFVIGNGTSTGNGQVEVGDRWRRQINGGHVHSDYLNNIALGICLVGDFNRDQPTRAQLDCCEELIRYLRQRCGKIDNSRYPIVKPHRDINPPRWPTDCPGNVFPYAWFRRFQE